MRQNLFRGMGILALILLLALLGAAVLRDRENQPASGEKKEAGTVTLEFQPEELVYDGNGELDLLYGVTNTRSSVTDLTEAVSAVITGDGSGNHKQVRYTAFSPSGEQATATRTLVLRDYDGPKITVDSSLELEAEDLSDLVKTLKERGEIRGENGFGVDITDQITWKREKISKGRYLLTFSLDNFCLDHTEQNVQAQISGEVRDLELTLVQSRIEIPQGSEFYPLDFLQEAQDPDFGSVADRVQVSSMVNTGVPGTYSVVYSVTSVDGTQTAEAVLSVTVTGGN